MITEINESKILTNIYDVNANVDLMEKNVIEISYGIGVYVNVSVKNVTYVKKIIFGILLDVVTKMKKYLASIEDNLAIKTVPSNSNEKKGICETQNFYILLVFLLITKGLLIAVSIYCYLIKYWAIQKHLLSFQVTNNKLK